MSPNKSIKCIYLELPLILPKWIQLGSYFAWSSCQIYLHSQSNPGKIKGKIFQSIKQIFQQKIQTLAQNYDIKMNKKKINALS